MLNPCHIITDWENIWVMDNIYVYPFVMRYSSVHVRFIGYMYVYIVDFRCIL